MKSKLISSEDLYDKLNEVFINAGLCQKESKDMANYFVTVEKMGIRTHGLSTIKTHLNKINSKQYNLKPNFSLEEKLCCLSIGNSDNAIGIISATYFMNYCVKLAKEKGIYIVHTNNSNTYGAAAYYNYLIQKNGLIGITFCNTPAAMAAYGGKLPLFGTNPFSIAIPANKMPPFILDISTSIVAKSKINIARINNQKIPEGWALDIEGNPTTDPISAIKGTILPMAGHKGAGIAMAIDIVAGLLSGAAYQDNVKKFYRDDECSSMNVGQVFIAIDPTKIYGASFFGDMDLYLKKVINQESREEFSLRYPGLDLSRRIERAEREGVTIDTSQLGL